MLLANRVIAVARQNAWAHLHRFDIEAVAGPDGFPQGFNAEFWILQVIDCLTKEIAPDLELPKQHLVKRAPPAPNPIQQAVQNVNAPTTQQTSTINTDKTQE